MLVSCQVIGDGAVFGTENVCQGIPYLVLNPEYDDMKRFYKYVWEVTSSVKGYHGLTPVVQNMDNATPCERPMKRADTPIDTSRQTLHL